jgi:hypothetical protein
MKILFTNIWLVNYAGTEVGIRDMALELVRRGHEAEVYSPALGAIAEDMQKAGIHVTDSVHKLRLKPDIIHAQHFTPALDVMLHFPDVPALYMLHDRTHPADDPPLYSQVLQYIAVDYNCLDRLIIDNGIEKEKTGILFNYVDTDRFKLRDKIAEKPKKAVVFSNYANPGNYFRDIAEACTKAGITLEGIGLGFGNPVKDPGKVLHGYDLVFAKAKAAMEAMATGAAVITCDFRGLGAFVDSSNRDHFRKFNFGMKTLNRPIETDLILEEINKYNPREIMDTARWIRQEASFSRYIDDLEAVYHNNILAFRNRQFVGFQVDDMRTLELYVAERVAKASRSDDHRVEEMKRLREQNDLNLSALKTAKIKLEKENRILRRNHEIIANSWSYRFGRLITLPLRLIWNLFK